MDRTLGRREFCAKTLGAMAAVALAGFGPGRSALAAALSQFGGHWLGDLDALGRDVKSQKLGQVEWQAKVEDLLRKVELPEFLKLIDFDAIVQKGNSYSDKGALSVGVRFGKAEGIPSSFVFGRQVFAMKRDRSIVPHGHNNMATAFLVLKGKVRGRHYERLEDQKEHLILKPTIDQEFEPGGASSISDQKDNVHWFQAVGGPAFIFNIHVLGVTPGKTEPSGRVYVDPAGEKLEGGRIRARLIGHEEADRLYG